MRLIDAEKMRAEAVEPCKFCHLNGSKYCREKCETNALMKLIDNAPTVAYTFEEAFQKTVCEQRLYCPKRPQGEYVDISKLRLMTVEECAGHTIDYAMGWKACIEWIKKGGAK